MALQPTGQLHNSAAPRIPGAEVGHSSVEIKQIEWPPTIIEEGVITRPFALNIVIHVTLWQMHQITILLCHVSSPATSTASFQVAQTNSLIS